MIYIYEPHACYDKLLQKLKTQVYFDIFSIHGDLTVTFTCASKQRDKAFRYLEKCGVISNALMRQCSYTKDAIKASYPIEEADLL